MQILLDILPLLNNEVTLNIRVLQEIIKSCYCISSGGVTMKNLSRWAGSGASYRTIQRFFGTEIAWITLNIILFQIWLDDQGIKFDQTRFVLAVDEVVVTKSRKQTYGVGWFYSSIIQKVCPSICTQVVSLIDTKKRRSFPLQEDQQFYRKPKKEVSQQKEKKSTKRKTSGRPPGSKNKNKTIDDKAIYTSLNKLLSVIMICLSKIWISPKYCVADGKYGNKNGVLIAQGNGLELISKLNKTSNLYFPYVKPGGVKQKGKRKYGNKLENLSEEYLVKTEVDAKGIKTEIYHYPAMYSRRIYCKINIVIIKVTKPNGKTCKVILFSSCLKLTWEQIINIYSCRFQIEFNFRDAKQYFGLSDFKNTKKQTVHNAINFSFFMVNISNILRSRMAKELDCEQMSIQDLKAVFRAQYYVDAVINYVVKNQEINLTEEQQKELWTIGAINLTKSTENKAA